MPATTSPTTATSTRSSARWPTSTRCSTRRTSRGIRVIVDLVPNHSSDQHVWFQEALAAGPGSRERARYLSATARARTANCRRTTGSRSSAARRGPAWSRPTARPASGTCTCSTRRSPTSTGRTKRCARSSAASCASGSTGASTASASTSRTASSRPDGLPDYTPPADAGSMGGDESDVPYWGQRRRARDLPRLAPAPRRVRRRPRAVRRGVAADARADRAVGAPRRDAPGVQLRLPRDRVGCRGPARRHHRVARAPTPRSAPRAPGCSRTTTSCATPRASR